MTQAMSEGIHIVCPHCDGINRIPPTRSATAAKCGRCHQALFTGQPVALTAERLQRHIQRSDLPLLVDFWADWCAPCRVMAPVFEQAAARLEPRVRLAKIDTDREQQAAAAYGIRGIPTLILFQGGGERARTSGAADLATLTNWVQQHLG